MGDPNASLGPQAGKDEPAEQHPGLEAVGLPASRSETVKPTQGIALQGEEPSGGRSAGGSLICLIVPTCNVARFSVDLVDNWSVLEAPWFVRCWGVGVGGMVAHP